MKKQRTPRQQRKKKTLSPDISQGFVVSLRRLRQVKCFVQVAG